MVKSLGMIKAYRYFGKYGAVVDMERHISDVIEAIEAACDIISKNGYDPIKYEYLMQELADNSKFVQEAIIDRLRSESEFATVTEDLFVEYMRYKETKGHFLYEGIDFDPLDDDLCRDIKMWAMVKDTQYYEVFYKLQDYSRVLSGKYTEYELYRSLEAEIADYKPAKEYRLESYFECGNIEALRSILHQDLRGKGGKGVAMVLVALEGAGCRVTGDFKPLFEKVFVPTYGAQGSRQAVVEQMKKVKDVTEKTDPNAAEQLNRLTEKYKKMLL